MQIATEKLKTFTELLSIFYNFFSARRKENFRATCKKNKRCANRGVSTYVQIQFTTGMINNGMKKRERTLELKPSIS